MRYRTLDSVRGIAAFAVVLCHSFLVFPGGGENREALLRDGFHAPMAWLYGTPLRLAVGGPAAVLLFFVLSGFVLTLTIASLKGPTYVPFAVARFARIWPPFAVAILGSAALCLLLAARPVPGASIWFHAAWSGGATPKNVLRHLTMTGTGIDLDSPMWSLVHELRISMILPLLVILTRRSGYAAILVAAILTLVSVFLNGQVAEFSHASSWISTVTYLYFFVIGILLALQADKVKVLLTGLPHPWIGLLWLLALTGIAIAPADTSHVVTLRNGLLLLADGIAAGLIISLSIIEGTAAKILLSAVPRYLGRISYSLYLTHLVVIVSVLHFVGAALPLPIAVITAIPLAIIVADVCQRLIEAPSQRLGKRVAAHIASRTSQSRTTRSEPVVQYLPDGSLSRLSDR